MIKDLITSKDISNIKKKALDGTIAADEANILQMAEWSEHEIQSACYKAFQAKHLGDNAIFVKIDNGRNHNYPTKDEKENNPLYANARVKSIHKSKKWQAAEGEQAGFPDVIIFAFGKMRRGMATERHWEKNFYIEFKKIGGKIAENQQKWHEFLKEKGELVYFCNNLLFFEKVILREVKQFLDD